MIIEPPRGGLGVSGAELWRYRELLFFLAWRDVKIRYKQTLLGAAWAVLQPLMAMAVFSLFFGRLAGLSAQTGDIPYPVYVYAGLLLWTLFAATISQGATSLVNSASLITKVYFPRILLPLAASGVALVDFGVSSGVMLLLMAAYGTAVSWQILLAPLFLAGTLLAAWGVGALLASLAATYRDFQYVVPFLVQIWLFITPVIYPSSLVPEAWRFLLFVNPMAGMVEGFRACLFGLPQDAAAVALSLFVAALLFLAGALTFARRERHLADVI
jgi:lipopolysaccharide transport system permease protein